MRLGRVVWLWMCAGRRKQWRAIARICHSQTPSSKSLRSFETGNLPPLSSKARATTSCWDQMFARTERMNNFNSGRGATRLWSKIESMYSRVFVDVPNGNKRVQACNERGRAANDVPATIANQQRGIMQVWHWKLDLIPDCVRRPKGRTHCRPKAVG